MAFSPPYPADLEAKGWSLDLDYEKIEQSDTWAIASAEQRPWLLMLWMVSWRQVPVASLPNDDRLIAARIGMAPALFTEWRSVLLSGWQLADDGRLYHKTLTQHALRMADKRSKDRARVAAFRAKSSGLEASNACVTRDQPVSSAPTPTPTPKEQELLSADKPLTPVSEKQASRQERLAQVTDEAIAAYNATLAKPKGLLPKVTKVGREKRRQQVAQCVGVAREICEEEYGSERIVPEFWTAYFTACAQDDFLAGRGPYTNGHENWRPDFKHLTKSETLLKVYDRTAGDSAE